MNTETKHVGTKTDWWHPSRCVEALLKRCLSGGWSVSPRDPHGHWVQSVDINFKQVRMQISNDWYIYIYICIIYMYYIYIYVLYIYIYVLYIYIHTSVYIYIYVYIYTYMYGNTVSGNTIHCHITILWININSCGLQYILFAISCPTATRNKLLKALPW